MRTEVAHGDCLVLPPCFTHGETEAHSSLGYLSSTRRSRAELTPRPGLHYARFWADWVPVGSRTRGIPEAARLRGPGVSSQVGAYARRLQDFGVSGEGGQPGTFTGVPRFLPSGVLRLARALAPWPPVTAGVSLANPAPCTSASSGIIPPLLSCSHPPA